MSISRLEGRVLLEEIPDFFYPETCLKSNLDFFVFRQDRTS
jgi:hypothetical protein